MKIKILLTFLSVVVTQMLYAETGDDPPPSKFTQHSKYQVVTAMTQITPVETGISSCNYAIPVNISESESQEITLEDEEKLKLPKSVLYSAHSNCIALAGTEIEIRGQEGDTVYFNVVNHVNLSPEDEQEFAPGFRSKEGKPWNQGSRFTEEQAKLLNSYFPVKENDQLKSRLVVKHLQYSVPANVLSRHIEQDGIWFSDLKAVLIPQKFYERKVYSSSPTIGIAATLIKNEKSRKQDKLMYDPSFEIGVGLTQATVDTGNGSEEKFGFALFAGINVIKGESFNLGLYYGHDFISLDKGESMNKATDETPAWLGIVLSTPLYSYDGKTEKEKEP